MSKLSYWLIVPLLAFAFLSAADQNKGDEAITDKHAAAVTFSNDRVAPVPTAAEQEAMNEATRQANQWRTVLRKRLDQDSPRTRQEAKARPERMFRESLRYTINRAQTQRGSSKHWSWGGRSTRANGVTRPKRIQGGYSTYAGEYTITVYDESMIETTAFTPGDIITISVSQLGTDTARIELYVDDGNGSFDPASDLKFPGEGEGDKMEIWDGHWEDETGPGDGIWQVTVWTNEMDDGPVFGIQGIRMHLYVESLDGLSNGVGSLDVVPPVTQTFLRGNVSIPGDPATPAPWMMIVAIPGWALTVEGPPENMFIALTGAEGNYEIAVPPEHDEEEYWLLAFDMWYMYSGMYAQPEFIPLYVFEDSTQENLNFELVMPTSSISGVLSDAVTGDGIAGIPIWAESEGPFEGVDTTDANGTFSIPVLPGWWRLNPDEDALLATGYMATDWDDEGFDIAPDSAVVVDIETYSADGTIAGTVLWVDSTPVAGAEIWVGTWGFYTYGKSGADGTYSLAVSTYLDTIIKFDRDGGAHVDTGYGVSAWVHDALTEPDGVGGIRANSVGVDFTAHAADAFLTGRIYNEWGGPLPWAHIRAQTISDETYFSNGEDTDRDGNYRLPLLGGYTWEVQIYYPDMWEFPALVDTIDLAVGDEYGKDYFLPPRTNPVAVEGQVMQGDLPVGNAYVELYNEYYYNWANTDVGGHFRIENVPPFSRFDLVVWPLDQPPHYEEVWTEDYDVFVPIWLGARTVRLDGYVTDEFNNPIFDAIVLAFGEGDGEPEVTFTDGGGYYELFLTAGHKHILAGATGYLADSLVTDLQTDLSHDFMLASAEALLTANIAGIVSSIEGYGLGNVEIGFFSQDYVAFISTNSEGSYSIDLVPGDYFVAFHKPGYLEESFDWTVPGGDVYDVTMYPRAMLKIISVNDVAPDHGGKVAVVWGVHEELHYMVKYFAIWQLGLPGDPEAPVMTLVGDHLSAHYGPENYRRIVATEADDIAYTYTVVAYDHGDWPIWFSDPQSGMSIDNLPPAPPQGVIAGVGETAGQVAITWDAANIEPIQYYTIYRSVDGGAFEQLDYSAEPGFGDNLATLGSYEYAVSATDYGDNESNRSSAATYAFLSIVDGIGIPDEFALKANYPNPFNPSTTIAYQLPEAGKVSLVVYDLMGNVVSTLVNESQTSGYYQTVWNGRDQRGVPVATGVYFYRLKAGAEFVKTHKMVLMK